jgi:hypothetical protein
MQDITTFVSKSTIKPELSMVYVHELNGSKYAVATDSYRLAQYKLPDFLQEHMQTGYYQPQAWKDLCKAYNKKNKDLRAIESILIQQDALQSQYNEYNYPEYQNIIPTEATILRDFNPNTDFNRDYFIDFINLINVDKYKAISFNDIKQNERGLTYYANEDIKLLLMPLNR